MVEAKSLHTVRLKIFNVSFALAFNLDSCSNTFLLATQLAYLLIVILKQTIRDRFIETFNHYIRIAVWQMFTYTK